MHILQEKQGAVLELLMRKVISEANEASSTDVIQCWGKPALEADRGQVELLNQGAKQAFQASEHTASQPSFLADSSTGTGTCADRSA